MTATKALAPLIAATTALALPSQPSQPVLLQRETWVMGTSLVITAVAPDTRLAATAIGAAFQAVRATDDLLSTWRDDTELSRLNRAPAGTPLVLSPALTALLAEVRRFTPATDGAFDPAIGALVEAYDLRGKGRRPDPGSLQVALEATGFHLFELDTRRSVARRLHPSAWIDSGGFGKGAALRAAADALRRHGIRVASLNFGGQVVVLGDASELSLVAVAHPARRQQPVLALRVRNASVATSGQSERPGHILDPRTGAGVAPWGSVTVVVRDPLVADILSTALFVMGPDQAWKWAKQQKEVAVLLLVDTEGGLKARCNEAMKRLLIKNPKVDQNGEFTL